MWPSELVVRSAEAARCLFADFSCEQKYFYFTFHLCRYKLEWFQYVLLTDSDSRFRFEFDCQKLRFPTALYCKLKYGSMKIFLWCQSPYVDNLYPVAFGVEFHVLAPSELNFGSHFLRDRSLHDSMIALYRKSKGLSDDLIPVAPCLRICPLDLLRRHQRWLRRGSGHHYKVLQVSTRRTFS